MVFVAQPLRLIQVPPRNLALLLVLLLELHELLLSFDVVVLQDAELLPTVGQLVFPPIPHVHGVFELFLELRFLAFTLFQPLL